MNVQVASAEVNRFANNERANFEAALKKLVDIPSVSMDPACKKDIARCAEAAAELLRSIGAKAEVVATRGNPVVYGELASGPGRPTVAVYNHLDVQPADPALWRTPPFDMTIDNGIYRGRGSTDDKGPALAVMYAAQWASQHKLPLNIKFIWELEEEIGSPSFEQFLTENRERLKTDSIVVSDTIWIDHDRPAIPYGLRGLQGIILRLRTGAKDIHSGLAGGLARNPLGELCQLIAECYDACSGEVKIPGFYDQVRQPSEAELEDFVKSGFSVDKFVEHHELSSVRTGDDRQAAERIWARPTFEVHGIVGGYTGPGVKTIIPHEAEAKITMRLVPDQDPDRIVQAICRFVKERLPDAEIIREGTLRPYLGDFQGPFADAGRRAVLEAFGVEPAFVREGGSIGAVVSMSEVLSVPIVFLGLSLPEHGYHAINENFDWRQASGGIRMFAHYFSLLAQMRS